MTNDQIARVAHEANRAYCASLGDISQLPWEEAPQWQRDSAMTGVTLLIEHPETTPEDTHKSWMAEKVAGGWKYGPVKSPEKREHPCIVPYAELPPVQKSKDWIFRGVVRALLTSS